MVPLANRPSCIRPGCIARTRSASGRRYTAPSSSRWSVDASRLRMMPSTRSLKLHQQISKYDAPPTTCSFSTRPSPAEALADMRATDSSEWCPVDGADHSLSRPGQTSFRLVPGGARRSRVAAVQRVRHTSPDRVPIRRPAMFHTAARGTFALTLHVRRLSNTRRRARGIGPGI